MIPILTFTRQVSQSFSTLKYFGGFWNYTCLKKAANRMFSTTTLMSCRITFLHISLLTLTSSLILSDQTSCLSWSCSFKLLVNMHTLSQPEQSSSKWYSHLPPQPRNLLRCASWFLCAQRLSHWTQAEVSLFITLTTWKSSAKRNNTVHHDSPRPADLLLQSLSAGLQQTVPRGQCYC